MAGWVAMHSVALLALARQLPCPHLCADRWHACLRLTARGGAGATARPSPSRRPPTHTPPTHTPPTHPLSGQVYLARWRETNVAVKLLLNTGVNVDDLNEAAEQAISLSNPILHNLETVCVPSVCSLSPCPRVSFRLGWQPPWRCLVRATRDDICTHAFGTARLCPAQSATLQDCRPAHTTCHVCVGCTAGGVSHGQPAPPQLHRLCGRGGHPTLRHHRILQVGATAAGGGSRGCSAHPACLLFERCCACAVCAAGPSGKHCGMPRRWPAALAGIRPLQH